VADVLMDRLATPAPGYPETGPMPEQTARDLGHVPRPRYEPRNMTFADGMDRWVLGGTFSQHASQAHWADYKCAAEDGVAVLSGSAWSEHEITVGIPVDASSIVFGIFLAGHGRIDLKDPGFLSAT
jgi:hypothetical protein